MSGWSEAKILFGVVFALSVDHMIAQLCQGDKYSRCCLNFH
jgi:hypothetical protein